MLCIRFFCSVSCHSGKDHKEEVLPRSHHVRDKDKKACLRLEWSVLLPDILGTGPITSFTLHTLLRLPCNVSPAACCFPSGSAVCSFFRCLPECAHHHPPVHSEHLLIGFVYSVTEYTELPAKGDSKYVHTSAIAPSLHTHLLAFTTLPRVITSSHLADRIHKRQLMERHSCSKVCCPPSQAKPYGIFVMSCRGW